MPTDKHNRLSKRARDGIFLYVRRVPKPLVDLVGESTVRIALGTRDLAEAAVKAREIDERNERYWGALAQGHSPPSARKGYEASIKLAKAMGFAYRTRADLASEAVPLDDLLARAEAIGDERPSSPVVAAVLGLVDEPETMVSQLWDIYTEHEAVGLASLSANQLRKLKGGRLRAIENFKAAIGGDKALSKLTRDDALKFRAWSAQRVTSGEIVLDSANRAFSDLKGMISVADEAYGTNYVSNFKSINIKERKGRRKQKKRTRPPYPIDFVQDKLLAADALDGLNDEARMVVYVMVETGLRLSETCNLRPEDIHLDAPIPFVSIEERDDREQKTAYSIRTVPLVGVSLWAMKQCPKGFPRYRDRGDSLSNTINKYFRENGLQPTPKHSVYCLRHTFQDRILAAGAPDRLQTDLMGHEFDREAYGEGASLQQKLDLLERVKFRWAAPIAT